MRGSRARRGHLHSPPRARRAPGRDLRSDRGSEEREGARRPRGGAGAFPGHDDRSFLARAPRRHLRRRRLRDEGRLRARAGGPLHRRVPRLGRRSRPRPRDPRGIRAPGDHPSRGRAARRGAAGRATGDGAPLAPPGVVVRRADGAQDAARAFRGRHARRLRPGRPAAGRGGGGRTPRIPAGNAEGPPAGTSGRSERSTPRAASSSIRPPGATSSCSARSGTRRTAPRSSACSTSR